MAGSDWREALVGAVNAGDSSGARKVAGRRLRAADRGGRADRDQVLGLLAQQASDGSPVAVEVLAEIVDETGLARAGVRRFLIDEEAVEDAAQETLLSMVASIDSFRGKSQFTTWLFQIARYRAVDHIRRKEREADSGDAPPRLSEKISSLVAERRTVADLVEQLPDHYRAAVVLRDLGRLPYAEVAERLDLNLNTTKSHVARGRALLARMIDDDDW